MGSLNRWFGLLAGWVLFFGVSCSGPGPACPTCPVMDFLLKGPRTLIIQDGESLPSSSEAWGRVAISLSPQAGQTWTIPVSKLKKDGEEGWVFPSKTNENKSVQVVLLGREEEGNVKVSVVWVSVWLGSDDVKSLASAEGLKIRLRLAELSQQPELSYMVSGSVLRHQPKEANKEACRAQFSLDAKFSSQPGSSNVIEGQCEGSAKSCWATCK